MFEINKPNYTGKVRNVYHWNNKIVMLASDRISAFDVVLPRPIPYKGQVLNQLAAFFLKATHAIVPNWLESTPFANVSIGKKCTPVPVEMVIRGYLAGHAWREYKAGKREICGVEMPEGLKEGDKLPQPIITPTTKASEGHDLDISKEEILKQNIVSKNDYERMEAYTRTIFNRGQKMAAERGLILVDTKYEFGYFNGEIILMDEIHTPDSSRYYYAEGYQERQDKGEKQQQLSKEFVREWLMENNFQGKEGETVPEMTDEVVDMISKKYIQLFELVTATKFVPENVSEKDIEHFFNQ